MAAALLVHDARHPDDGRPIDVLVEDGRVARVEPGIQTPERAKVLEAGGHVIIPALVDAHLHLDKTLMGEPWVPLPEASTLEERSATSDQVLADSARWPVEVRASALVRSALAFGTTALRTHADVTPRLGLASVNALLEIRQQFADLVDVQVVAFPQEGVLRAPGTEDLLDEALSLGADALGGIDPAGIDVDVEGHLRILFTLAEKHEVPIDIHLHDPGHLGAHQLERITAWTVARGFRGRVAVSHAFALGEVGDAEAARVIEKLAEAEVTIVTNGAGHRAPPRLRELWAAGVRVAIGSDHVHDAWWPYGRGDMLERAFLVAYRNALRTDDDLRRALGCATAAGATLLDLAPRGLDPGAQADLILVDAQCAAEAVAAHPPRLAVIRRGRVVSR